MGRRLPLVALLAGAFFACWAGAAQARPVVNFGSLVVGTCNTEISLNGCLHRRIWFSNHTDQPIKVESVGITHADVFDYVSTGGGDCLLQAAIPAHGSCFELVYAGPLQVGPARGLILLGSPTGAIVRQARLLVTGLAAPPPS